MDANLDLLSTRGPSLMPCAITGVLLWQGRNSVNHGDLLISALPWVVPTPPHPWPEKGSPTIISSPEPEAGITSSLRRFCQELGEADQVFLYYPEGSVPKDKFEVFN